MSNLPRRAASNVGHVENGFHDEPGQFKNLPAKWRRNMRALGEFMSSITRRGHRANHKEERNHGSRHNSHHHSHSGFCLAASAAWGGGPFYGTGYYGGGGLGLVLVIIIILGRARTHLGGVGRPRGGVGHPWAGAKRLFKPLQAHPAASSPVCSSVNGLAMK